MELHQLRSFQTVAQTGSIKAAADKLYITQSALSRTIARLEGEIGLQLFDRSPGKITLNAAGADFLQCVTAALELLDSAVLRLRAAEAPPEILLANLTTIDILYPISEKCQALFTDLLFHADDITRNRTLLSDFSKFSILLSTFEPGSPYRILRSYRQPWCAVCNSAHSLGSLRIPLTLERLFQKTLTFFDAPFEWELVGALERAAGQKARTQAVTDLRESARLINSGKCVGLLPVSSYQDLLTHMSGIPVRGFVLADFDCTRPIYLSCTTALYNAPGCRSALDYIVSQVDAVMATTNDFCRETFSNMPG